MYPHFIQIYCDFAGYSIIAVGTAKILGISLMENFDAPYLSTSVSEFWRKWHISLTSWFKDYLYIPLGGSHNGKFRKYFNIMLVFLASGLWHGASISFLIWGGINGLYQIFGDIIKPIRDNAVLILKLHRNSLGHKIIHIIGTFILIDISWIFFRASRAKDGFKIIKSMFLAKNLWILFDGSLYNCGLDIKNFWLMIYAIMILLVVDFCKYKKIAIRKIIIQQDYWFRWLFIAIAITIILTFGIWGPGYSESNFIYFQF